MRYRIFLLSLTLWGARPVHSQSLEDGGSEIRDSALFHQHSSRESEPSAVLSFEQYTSSARPAFGDNFYSSNTWVEGAWRGHGDLYQGFFYSGDFKGLYSTSDRAVYPLIKEVYLGKTLSQSQVRFGVINEEWSGFEEEWRIGLFRPRFMHNKLSGGQGGLFGLYGGPFRGVTLGILPLFVPELGPHFEINDGELSSKNPWFGQLPRAINYNGSEATIRYKVKIPPVKDIVLKPGVVMGWSHQFHKSYQIQVSGAYKPMPQLLLNFPAERRFVIGSEDQYFEAEVNPWVAYHGVIAMDHIFSNETQIFRFSMAHEEPDVPERPRSWVTQEIGPATFLSSRLESSSSFLGSAKLFLSQFKVWGGDRPDEGRYATDESFFESRQFFREAYGFGVETFWPIKIKAFSSASLIYDRIQEGGAFFTHHTLFLKDNLQLTARLEFLGLLRESNPQPTGFLSRYRANDRAELGVSYGF